MISSVAVNPKHRLKNLLDHDEVALAAFATLHGSRAAQVLSHTGLDASQDDGYDVHR